MPYASLMVHLDIGRPNVEVLQVAADLGIRLGARIIGIAACQPVQLAYAEGGVSGAAIVACRDELDRELQEAEAAFRAALGVGTLSVEWRSSVTTPPLADYLASQARCADLIVTRVQPADFFDPSRHVGIGEVVMRSGRPVLVVPADVGGLPLDRVVVAWKDTREARRAVADALPLLALAKHVTVAEVAGQDDHAHAMARVQDVATWLARHGILAAPLVTAWGADETGRLGALLDEQKADLVVAGAYGHSRLREWAFGGITRELLMGNRCALLSH